MWRMVCLFELEVFIYTMINVKIVTTLSSIEGQYMAPDIEVTDIEISHTILASGGDLSDMPGEKPQIRVTFEKVLTTTKLTLPLSCQRVLPRLILFIWHTEQRQLCW